MSLEKLRKKIDSIDIKVIGLLNERAKLALSIGKLKARKKVGVYVPGREKEVYDRLSKKSKGPLGKDAINAIYREVMSASLSLMKPVKIAYLGPSYTFTHLASLKKFGSSVGYVGVNNITDVFTEVDKGRCDYGVVPIENSVEGAVNHTLDMFIESDLLICSEIYLEISHNVFSRTGKKRDIKRIYSNPQVFGQCRLWLESNLPQAELVEVSSTARAAELAAKNKNAACIASALAGEKYKLKAMACSIEDSSHNTTRFLVIAKETAKPTKHDKTSIAFSIKDRVGGLHDVLAPFKKNSINLTKIESRPSKKKAWKYYFFVDMEGHVKNNRINKALKQLKRNCTFVKVLGSYPVA